jgi:hypothetical protein
MSRVGAGRRRFGRGAVWGGLAVDGDDAGAARYHAVEPRQLLAAALVDLKPHTRAH